MRKNSPYTRFFREAIQQLAENGQLGKYRLNASKSRKNCKQPRTKGDALGKWFFKSILVNLKVFTARISGEPWTMFREASILGCAARSIAHSESAKKILVRAGPKIVLQF